MPTPQVLAVESECQCQHIYPLVFQKASFAFYRWALGNRVFWDIDAVASFFPCHALSEKGSVPPASAKEALD